MDIEHAADVFLSFGVRTVIIRSGPLGAYIKESKTHTGTWIPAFFSGTDSLRVIDVTGAGNAFLGGLVAGLSLTNGDVLSGKCRNHAHLRVCNVDIPPASLYATVSASYTIEQKGLPRLTRADSTELWNNDRPSERLQLLKSRLSDDIGA
jgi:sugar/nucleoside kinase (ribokinase family)